MALVLPSSIDYKESLPALPDACQQIPVASSPVNGASFQSGQQIYFDLLNRGFLVPDSMYLSYSYSVTNGATANYWKGVPVYSAFNRLDVQMGSQTVDTIQNYGVTMHLLVNTQYDVAQKYGMQACFGFDPSSNINAIPNLEELDGKYIAPSTTVTGSVSAPLVSLLSNSEKLIPLFAMPQIRLILTLDSLSNQFTGSSVSGFTMSNVELRYKVIDMGGAVENVVLNMGPKLYIKSQSFSCASQTLPATTGYNELVFNQRFASVKSLYAINGGGANGVNGMYDSIDLTSNNGDYSFMIGGVLYPQKPISTSTCKTQALMELKSAVGSIYDKSNNMSINKAEFSFVAGNTTSATAPAKFFIGTSTEKLNSNNLLTGISTQNSPISYRINTGTSTGSATTVSLVVNYDALIEVDTMTRQASVKA
jgi:hypothetical protein